jgi:hypothetical protein
MVVLSTHAAVDLPRAGELHLDAFSAPADAMLGVWS